MSEGEHRDHQNDETDVDEQDPQEPLQISLRNEGEDPLLAAAWALDALEEDERAAFEERLRTRPEERADADALRETASRLAGAVPPPPRMRASILAAIATTPQEGAHRQDGLRQEGLRRDDHLKDAHRRDAAPAARPPAPQAPRVVDLAVEREKRRGPSRWSVLVAAAGIVVAAVGVGVGVTSGPEAAPVLSAEQQARAEVGDLLTAPGARISTVTASGGGTATLVLAEGRLGVLTADLPAPGTGQGYQLWLATGEDIASAGMLSVSAAGGSATVVDAGQATGLGISVEPAAGSEQPTTTPVVFTPLAV